MKILRKVWAGALCAAGLTAWAEAPAGYYSACEGKTGQELLESLCRTISDHTVVSYSGLWSLYRTTDTDADGRIWDMYSTKRWTYASEQCGNYSYIGDCYNREHSMPKSWFDDASPMVSDAFHIYPTDGKVNGQRSNYPFGECAGGSYVASRNGVKPLGRLGSSTFEGYTGTVFEPDDQYKGDFARTYFYMAACYNDRIASWASNKEAKPMLAGNSYPVFTEWAVDLLLKWSRMDEVSSKETDRNDAVYAAQMNRNPFIDHPELAEYIWGNKKGEAWHADADSEAAITAPVEGTTIDLGYAVTGVRRTATVAVKGRNLSETVSVSISGAGFSVSPTTLTADAANAGAEVTVSYLGYTAGDAEGTLTVGCGQLSRSVDITARVEDGLPLFEAEDVTSESFTARWIYLGDATDYTLDVRQSYYSVPGYPRQVDAAVERYTVEGLDPATDYTFTLSSGSLTSATRSVTTAELVPSIAVLFDGELAFESTVGEPSAIAELLLETENISDDITVRVNAPFEVSTDKTVWSTSVTLAPEEDRFYMRLNGATAGTFTTSVIVVAGACVNDDAVAKGTVSDLPAADGFVEDWEGMDSPATNVKCYSTKQFEGHAALWSVENGGFGDLTQDKAFNGTTVLRMNKATATANSSLTLDEDKSGGIGTVSFDAARWSAKDKEITLAIEYSDDRGATWTTIDSPVLSEITSMPYSVTVNRSGNGRIRFKAAAGSGRWFIDNIAITNYSSMSAIAELDYHLWDAYCSGGRLVIESRDGEKEITVYGIDGITYYSNRTDAGRTEIALPKGLYVVTADGFARRVLVK